jgi:hypothetical protein
MSWIPFYIFILDAMRTAVFGFLIAYYFGVRAKKINKIINDLIDSNQMSGHQISSAIKLFICEHNQICTQLLNYNRFWKKLYFSFIFTIIPMNLCLLHQFLFEKLIFYNKAVFGFSILIQLIFIFLVQFMVASLSSKIHKTGKRLSRLQWKINGWPFRARTKIKILNTFERLSSDRKIGFTIGSLAVMTFPLFYRVINFLFLLLFKNKLKYYLILQLVVMYVRYFMLVHKFARD